MIVDDAKQADEAAIEAALDARWDIVAEIKIPSEADLIEVLDKLNGTNESSAGKAEEDPEEAETEAEEVAVETVEEDKHETVEEPTKRSNASLLADRLKSIKNRDR